MDYKGCDLGLSSSGLGEIWKLVFDDDDDDDDKHAKMDQLLIMERENGNVCNYAITTQK